jgi:putative flavoprotein involved in K+ transport
MPGLAFPGDPGRYPHRDEVAAYLRRSHGHAGQRIIVVGAGNSAVQVGYELAQVATVTLATRHPVTFRPQCRDGQDMHYWLKTTGFDLLPPQWLRHYLGGRTVVDTGKYQHAVATGQLDRRPMFTAFGRDHVIWPDGTREKVDTVVFATGYRPAPGLPQPARGPGRPRPAAARRRDLGHPSRPGLPRPGVPAVVLL